MEGPRRVSLPEAVQPMRPGSRIVTSRFFGGARFRLQHVQLSRRISVPVGTKRHRGAVILGVGIVIALLVAFGATYAWTLKDNVDDRVLEEHVYGVRNLPDGAYSYVILDGEIRVYAIDRNHTLVKRVVTPDRFALRGIRGVTADASSHRLYVSYWGDTKNRGSLLAYDLHADRVLWRRTYKPSVDSMALTPDGRKLYMPCGEERTDCDHWFVLNTTTGEELHRIAMHEGAHNTIVSSDGKYAYLASLKHNYLAEADTRTDRINRWIGPFGDSIRPFTINHAGSFAFVTVDNLSGFEVADLRSGRKLYRVEVKGFPLRPEDYPAPPATQTHGIALTPDESEVWIVDAFYRHLHVFDATPLPDAPPRQIADIELADLPKWINFTGDGRYAHVSTGEIVDTRTRRTVALVESSRQFLQIDWAGGKAVRAYSRYGLGYADRVADGDS
jgi:DNA-binding beta-propeller fold protein YncE